MSNENPCPRCGRFHLTECKEPTEQPYYCEKCNSRGVVGFEGIGHITCPVCGGTGRTPTEQPTRPEAYTDQEGYEYYSMPKVDAYMDHLENRITELEADVSLHLDRLRTVVADHEQLQTHATEFEAEVERLKGGIAEYNRLHDMIIDLQNTDEVDLERADYRKEYDHEV